MSQRRHPDDSHEELTRWREEHRSLFALGGMLLFAVFGLGAYLLVGALGWVPTPRWLIAVWGLALTGNLIILMHPHAQRLGELSAKQDEQ